MESASDNMASDDMDDVDAEDANDDNLFPSMHSSKQDKAASSSSSSTSYLDKTDTTFYLQDDARTDIRNLLTQRSIQQFMKLCEDCRDPHTVSWLNDYLLHPTDSNTAVEQQQYSIMDYYGTGSKFLEDHFQG